MEYSVFVVLIFGMGQVLPVPADHNVTIATRDDEVTIVTRDEWGARDSKEINYMGTPVSVVVVHHTAMNECLSKEECMKGMRAIQDFHMDDRGWDDIGYNFLVGEDGRAYEGRAWDRIGAHTRGWNDVAIAFSVMGNYMEKLPNDKALNTLQNMIELGIRLGKIRPDYKLYGHRDVRNTACPGDRLYELIETWEHFDHNTPVKPQPLPYNHNTTSSVRAPTTVLNVSVNSTTKSSIISTIGITNGSPGTYIGWSS